MKNNSQNNAQSIFRSIKLAVMVILLIGFLAPVAVAQNTNTKGDTPAPKQSRDKKFSGRSKKTKKGLFGRRVKSRDGSAIKANANYPVPVTARKSPKGGAEKVGQPLNRIYRSVPSVNERRIYPQRGPFVHNPSRNPRKIKTRIYSNRQQLAQNRRSQTFQQGGPGKGSRRVGGRSSSRPYISHKSINPFAGFWNKKRKGEKAWTGDISGRRPRTKNFHTQKPPPEPSYNPYFGRKRIGDQPYKGRVTRVKSATQSGRAWKGDITGRRIRGRNFHSKQPGDNIGFGMGVRRGRLRQGDRPYKGIVPGKGAESVSGKKKRWSPLPRKYGIDRSTSWQGNIRGRSKAFRPQGEGYSGNIRGRKAFKPQGEGYSGNIRGRKAFKPQGEGYSGNIRGKKTFRPQGEEYSGNIRYRKTFRPQGEEYSGNIRYRKTFRPQGEEYSGNIKARRPKSGGGSVTGFWNNKGRAIVGKSPGIGAKGVDDYSGNIKGGKTFRPQGEEYSGNIRYRKTFRPQGEEYSGNIKTRRPKTGGGSVTGFWNNKGRPIVGKSPGIGARGIDEYSGNIKGRKTFRPQGEEYSGNIKGKKTFQPQGEEYSGNIKARRPQKGGGSVSGKLWNNKEQPIPGKSHKDVIEPFPGKYKESDLIPKLQDQGEEFRGGIKLSRFKRNYIHNPNAAKEALKAKRESANTRKVDNIYGKIKQYDYRHNPSSAKEALNVREPGKAFGRAVDYQGNVKMKKFEIFGRKGYHPDAQFVKTNKNNVKEERGLMTNIKLLWGKLFRKNSNQPTNLKEKYRKPRYDKGEQGLWYD